MNRWLIRLAATATVVAGLVVAGAFSRPTPVSEIDAARTSLEVPRRAPDLLATADRLPVGWSSRVLRHLESQRPPMETNELQSLVRVVEKSARRFDLDPLALLAVIQVESRFNPWAVSEQGSVGLMQLQLGTARELAGRLGMPWTSDESLFDPEVNIVLGSYYLRQLLDQFGDFDLAFAAYNLGPGRVGSRLDRTERVPETYCDQVWKAIVALHSRART